MAKVLSVVVIALRDLVLEEILTSLEDLAVESGKPVSKALIRVWLTPSASIGNFDSGCLSRALLTC